MSLTTQLQRGYAPGVPTTVFVDDSTIGQMVNEVAQRYPGRVAMDFFSKTTTYDQMMQQVARARTVLVEVGVKPHDRVALILPNCPTHIVVALAILHIGAVVVEHNPLAPQAELEGEFKRHGARTVIAWDNVLDRLNFLPRGATLFGVDLADSLPKTSRLLLTLPIPATRKRHQQLGGHRPLHIPSFDDLVAKAHPTFGPCPVSADDPAVLMHTGGTTGTPKAAVLTHRNLLANVAQDVAWVPHLHEGAEVFDLILPLFHAFGFGIGFLAAIRMGATMVVFPKFDTTMVLSAQKRIPCTFFLGVTPMYSRLLDRAEQMDVDLSSIKVSLCGAMPMDQALARRWEKATGGLVIEGYGMTEASPVILGNPCSPQRSPGALGLPYPSTEVRLIDPEHPDQDVPDGQVGEIICRGPQVFSGYLDAPEETAHALIDGWLHTGDLGMVKDGTIVMADRRKEMINTHGFNVYPSQVEEILRGIPGVRDVAVVGIPEGEADESVVAALILDSGASVTLESVREWAEKSLAHYALPRQIVVLNELPKSQLGKVMRRRVREQVLGVIDGTRASLKDLASKIDTSTHSSGPIRRHRLESHLGDSEDQSSFTD